METINKYLNELHFVGSRTVWNSREKVYYGILDVLVSIRYNILGS